MSLAIQLEVYRSKHTKLAARLVLLAMADAANDTHRMCWESVGTIAAKANIGERQTYNVLRDLEERQIIERVPDEEKPPEALRYKSVVRRIRPVEDWLDEGGKSEVDMQNLQDPNSDKPSLQNLQGADFSSNPNNQLGVIEETTFLPPRRSARSDPDKAEETSRRPGAKGWDAVAPLRRGGRKKTRKQEALEREAAEKELDPAYIVAQALATGYPGEVTEAAVAAEQEDLAPPVRRGREERSMRPSEVLANFFDKRAQEVGHPVPGSTNLAALTGQFGRWMREGTDKETITKMIITYWSASWQRSDSAPAWRDFLAQRGLLTKNLGKKAEAQQVEENRYDEDAW